MIPGRNSLKVKINILVIPLTVFILSLAGLVSFLGARNSLAAELDARAYRIVYRLENALRIPLWGYNMDTAQAFVMAELNDPDVISISIIEGTDSVSPWFIYVRDENGELHLYDEEPAQKKVDTSAIITVEGSILYNGNQIGSIVIKYSRQSAMAEIRTQAIVLFSGVVVVIIVLAAALNVVLNSLVVKPIGKIVGRMKYFSEEQGGSLEFGEQEDEIAHLSAAFDQMLDQVWHREGALRGALAEKEILLREVHHRVKNNFQVLASLFSLQMPKVSKEAAASLQEGYNRIYSMSLVHEKLYESDNLEKIDVSDYFRDLIDVLKSTYGSLDIMVSLESEEILLDLDTAIPLGLIVNELVSNSFKHAFNEADLSDKRVELVCKSGETGITVSVSDSGKGLPEGFEIERDASLGMDLIVNLSAQLNGKWTMHSDIKGTRFDLIIPSD
ncbi:sensor histidine kinase [Spirochaeta dissipatitropha]